MPAASSADENGVDAHEVDGYDDMASDGGWERRTGQTTVARVVWRLLLRLRLPPRPGDARRTPPSGSRALVLAAPLAHASVRPPRRRPPQQLVASAAAQRTPSASTAPLLRRRLLHLLDENLLVHRPAVLQKPKGRRGARSRPRRASSRATTAAAVSCPKALFRSQRSRTGIYYQFPLECLSLTQFTRSARSWADCNVRTRLVSWGRKI